LDTVVLEVIFVPPVLEVYHPSNEYPVLVGVGRVPYVELYVTVLLVVLDDPPFAFRVTLIVFAVQLAVTVAFDEPIVNVLPERVPLVFVQV